MIKWMNAKGRKEVDEWEKERIWKEATKKGGEWGNEWRRKGMNPHGTARESEQNEWENGWIRKRVNDESNE